MLSSVFTTCVVALFVMAVRTTSLFSVGPANHARMERVMVLPLPYGLAVFAIEMYVSRPFEIDRRCCSFGGKFVISLSGPDSGDWL